MQYLLLIIDSDNCSGYLWTTFYNMDIEVLHYVNSKNVQSRNHVVKTSCLVSDESIQNFLL